MSKKQKFTYYPVFDGLDIPDWVEKEYLLDQDISTHYANSLYQVYGIKDKENKKLIKWLVSEGVDVSRYEKDDILYIGIIGT